MTRIGEETGNTEDMLDTLANYYEEHHGSFDGLEIPVHLRQRFEKYRAWALEYYRE